MLRLTAILLFALTGVAQASAAQPVAAQPMSSLQQSQVEAAMALPQELRTALATLELGPNMPELDRVRRLYEFMVSDEGLALRYQEQPTYGIAESYAQRKVNCLSFTMMFIAMARASGLDVYAQTSDEALAARVLDDTLYRAKHVKVGVDVQGQQYTVDVGWRSVVSELRPRPISDIELVALLYNNNAVEFLLKGDNGAAATAIAKALALDTNSATIWNNAGVVDWRQGRHDAAEHAYLRALALQQDHVGALSNLVVLYDATGAERAARKYRRQLARAEEEDPFSQFLMAQQLTRQGAYDDALAHYRRAIRLLPNEPTFHRSMAEAYQMLGNAAAAQRARDRADSLELRKVSQRGLRDSGSDAG